MASKDAHESERKAAAVIVERAQAQQLWIGDRHFCTQAILQSLSERGTGFVVREQHIELAAVPTQGGAEPAVVAHLNELPHRGGLYDHRTVEQHARHIDAASIARLYLQRWRIEGMFHRLESVLNNEIKSLSHPRAALLDFAVAVLAYNVLALQGKDVERDGAKNYTERGQGHTTLDSEKMMNQS